MAIRWTTAWLDYPAASFDQGSAFWQAVTVWSRLTGWPQAPGSRPEFTFLSRPEGMPLRLLLQRLDEPTFGLTACTAHLDLACDDVPAEIARHVSLGASVVRVMTKWTTLRDPAGLLYCITRRKPATGKL